MSFVSGENFHHLLSLLIHDFILFYIAKLSRFSIPPCNSKLVRFNEQIPYPGCQSGKNEGKDEERESGRIKCNAINPPKRKLISAHCFSFSGKSKKYFYIISGRGEEKSSVRYVEFHFVSVFQDLIYDLDLDEMFGSGEIVCFFLKIPEKLSHLS